MLLQSLQIPPISGLTKKRRYLETGAASRRFKRSHIIIILYNQEKPYLGLENAKMGTSVGRGIERKGSIYIGRGSIGRDDYC